MDQPKERQAAADDPRVLFIAGYLRSGSTLLERMLGQVEGITAVGEVRYVWTNGFKLNELCGCGLPFRACPFWGEVVRDAFGGFDRVDADHMAGLQRAVDRLWHLAGMITPMRTRRYGRLMREYVDNLERLIRALHRVSGSRVIVDSSKAPSHGALIRFASQIDVDVVHLVRDSRAVAHSWSRRKRLPGARPNHEYMPRYGPGRAALEWDVMNVAAHVLRLGSGRYLLLRYEDLVADPEDAVSTVLSAIGAPAGPLDFLSGKAATLQPDHTVSGNPVRFETGEVKVVADVAWQSELSVRDRRVVTATTWPLLRAYGYGPRGDDR